MGRLKFSILRPAFWISPGAAFTMKRPRGSWGLAGADFWTTNRGRGVLWASP